MTENMIFSVAFAGLAVTQVVETARAWLDKKDRAPKGTWNIAAFGLGIAAAFGFDAAGIQLADAADKTAATGVIIGAMASGWYKLLNLATAKAKKIRAETPRPGAPPTPE